MVFFGGVLGSFFQLLDGKGGTAYRGQHRPFDHSGQTQCTERQRGGGRRVTAFVQTPLRAAGCAFESADDAIERGPPERTSSLRGHGHHAAGCVSRLTYRRRDGVHGFSLPFNKRIGWSRHLRRKSNAVGKSTCNS